VPTIDRCLDCPYRAFGPAIGTRGHPASPIVIVGEAPGANEIEQGRPFVGRAGDVLWGALAEVGLSEADVFVTNAVACQPRPTKPKVGAINACRVRLVRDIEVAPRSAIVALGGTAVRALTGQRGFHVLAGRGHPLVSPWGPIVPTLHPARVLRRPHERPWLDEDLRTAAGLAGGAGRWGLGRREWTGS
jgi:uracil-DNA glycosylase family 4